jgi:hypothetical protein
MRNPRSPATLLSNREISIIYHLVSFIKKYLGSPTDIDVEKLKIEYEKLKDENLRLQKQVDELKKEVMTPRYL